MKSDFFVVVFYLLIPLIHLLKTNKTPDKTQLSAWVLIILKSLNALSYTLSVSISLAANSTKYKLLPTSNTTQLTQRMLNWQVKILGY